jgi:hypothetical protein
LLLLVSDQQSKISSNPKVGAFATRAPYLDYKYFKSGSVVNVRQQ